jgi:CheY-like chemotaxis protein
MMPHSEKPPSAPARIRRVLIVEDDPDIRELLKELLELEHYEVRTARNGQEGIDALNQMGCPCLVLLDLFMPVMSGREFLDALDHDKAHAVASIPIIVLSAAPPEGEEVRAVRPRASAFVRKPVDIDAFLKIVSRFCVQPQKTA